VATKTIAQRLIAVLEGLDITAAIGAPKNIGPKVAAWVTMGSQQYPRKTTGTVQAQKRFFVLFLYRVDGDESTAEIELMDLVDAFAAALLADLTLAGTGRGLEIDTGLADEPEYSMLANKEYRAYPVLVSVTAPVQSYEVNP
jgi:hypothetical protein